MNYWHTLNQGYKLKYKDMFKKTIKILDSLLSWKSLMWLNIIDVILRVIDAVYNQNPMNLNFVIRNLFEAYMAYLLHTMTKENNQYKQLYGPLSKK